MLNLIKILALAWVSVFTICQSWASEPSLGSSASTIASTIASSSTSTSTFTPDSSNSNTQPIEETVESPLLSEKLKNTLGITYFSFFYGPGIHPDNQSFNPNQLGNPQNDGTYFQNQISFRYKFSNKFAFDWQNRFNLILNNSATNPNYTPFRWETPRVGISGDLLTGKDWSLRGAANTDFPYTFPPPLTGYQAQQRTVLFDPGLFAGFRYEPRQSRWSIFSVVSPRYFLYADRNAAEPQLKTSGLNSGNKPELILAFLPTANYRLTPQTQLTVGTGIDYRKHVVSNWNMFNVSLITNGDNPAWRLGAVPLNLGITHQVSQAFTIFPFIATYPIAIQRVDANTGAQTTLLEATSFGMWLNGTIL